MIVTIGSAFTDFRRKTMRSNNVSTNDDDDDDDGAFQVCRAQS